MREESSSDSSRAFQRRRWLVDSPKFVEDAAPMIAVAFETPSAISDVFHIPTVIPESKRAHFEIWVYSSVNHSIYATDFNDPWTMCAQRRKLQSEGGFLIWSHAFQ